MPADGPEVMQMLSADAVLARLDAARGVPAILAATWDAFDFIRASAAELADPGSDVYAALLLAAVSAAAGRDAVGFAPSMPAGPGGEPAGDPGAGGIQAADVIAGLAAALLGHLSAAAGQAPVAGDRSAFERAATEAGSIRDLLAAGER